eukprot:TRINITY_DN10115_c0_g1_i1.p1 TRINITY_DN10115_c0_g1~~TRINITY_DN10115_c0_g1_i1.p1  ORF type:complete len:628 (+),score=195.50 TRINITY_DN10115_c0_g1_i1:59-1885(+)
MASEGTQPGDAQQEEPKREGKGKRPRVTRAEYKDHEREVRTSMRHAQKKYFRATNASFTAGDSARVGGRRLKGMLDRAKKDRRKAAFAAARAEIVYNTEDSGFLEAGEGEETRHYSQEEIKRHLDTQTLRKCFDLTLTKLGPYVHAYSPNGNALCLAGEKGHAAVFNWKEKKLYSEEQHKDRISDVTFLHNETLFAAAQRQYTYIYNQEGQEIHLLKDLQQMRRLDFLPHHFLLTAVGRQGVLMYFDVSTGQLVAVKRTRMGPCHVMRQNPNNAVIALGHNRGQVSLWSPSANNPLVKVLCHKTGLSDVCFSRDGRCMATAGTDSKVLLWDTRMWKSFNQVSTVGPTRSIDISQTGLLAIGTGHQVDVVKDWYATDTTRRIQPYMTHYTGRDEVAKLRFCPYEDFLGVGHSNGFSSLVVPGAGEANYDYSVANPYENRRAMMERPVRQLLDKLAPELITMNPHRLGEVDRRDKKVKQSVQDRQEKFFKWNQSMTGIREEDAGSDEEKIQEAESKIVRPEVYKKKKKAGRKPKGLKEKKLYLQKQEHSQWLGRAGAKRKTKEESDAPDAKRQRTDEKEGEGEGEGDPLGDFFKWQKKAKEVVKQSYTSH